MTVEVIEVGPPVGTVFVGAGVALAVSRLDDLTDVDGATAGVAGQTLVLAGDGQWRPAAPAAVSTFVHTQTVPQAVVTITHDLGRNPPVVALFSLDLAQNYDAFQVTHLDLAQLRISIDNPTAYIALIQ